MPTLLRPAEYSDVNAMAEIRARRWGTPEFWISRIEPYLKGAYFPKDALAARAVFVAEADGVIVGFTAGHGTRRFRCDGELQWIEVAEEQRHRGHANKLLACIGRWFVVQGLRRICVNVDSNNVPARNFYARHNAVPLSEHWMVWEDAASMCQKAD